MGKYNHDSIYHQAYTTVADESHPSSHHFLHSRLVTAPARRLALKYRGGLIYNAKLAVRYKRATTASCPLCGQPDSQSHLLGGCSHPDMQRQYIARHHHANRLLALSMVRHLPHHRIVQSDIGACTSLSAALSHVPHHVPKTYLRQRNVHTLPRPDITILRRAPDGAHHLAFYDLKYGPDTRLEDKEPTARSHYDPLIRATRPRLRPTLHILLLGVGGRIPMAFFRTVLYLGMPLTAATRLCNSLNRSAVKWMRTIVATRRRLEPD